MAVTTIEARWYALQVRPNYEMVVSARLRELGIEEYLPSERTSPAFHRKRLRSGSPLFPGYTFSHLNLHAGPKLYNVPGVLRILGNGGEPTPLEDDEIAMVRSIANSPFPVEPVPYFHPGQEICLLSGPLKGVSGTFLRSGRDNQLIVSLPLLKRSLAVTVVSEWVMSKPPRYRSTEIAG